MPTNFGDLETGSVAITGNLTVAGTEVVNSSGKVVADIVAPAGSISNSELADMATKTYKGRTVAGTGVPADVPVATLKSDLNLTKSDVGLGNVANTAQVTSVSGTAPVTSSGGTTPAISMAAATAGNDGYMTSVYATKLDGIASGAQPGTVTDVSGTSPISSSGGTTPAISIAAASGGSAGSMSAAHYTKLEGISAGTNVKAVQFGSPLLAVDDAIVATEAMKATAYTIADSTPDSMPRNLTVTHATVDVTDTFTDVLVTGTNAADAVINEAITISADGIATGVKAFKTVTSILTPDWVIGGGTADNLKVGFGDLVGFSTNQSGSMVFAAFLAGVPETTSIIEAGGAAVENDTVDCTGLSASYDGSKVLTVLQQV